MITDFNEAIKKRDKLRFAEINTKSDGTYLSTSIWDGIELHEMLWHATRGKPAQYIYNLIKRIILGEELSFIEGDITSTFRLATAEDIKRATADMLSLEKELAEHPLPSHIKNIETAVLKELGLTDDNN